MAPKKKSKPSTPEDPKPSPDEVKSDPDTKIITDVEPAPKRKRSAYNTFVSQTMADMRNGKPALADWKDKPVTEKMKKCAELWRNMGESERRKLI